MPSPAASPGRKRSHEQLDDAANEKLSMKRARASNDDSLSSSDRDSRIRSWLEGPHFDTDCNVDEDDRVPPSESPSMESSFNSNVHEDDRVPPSESPSMASPFNSHERSHSPTDEHESNPSEMSRYRSHSPTEEHESNPSETSRYRSHSPTEEYESNPSETSRYEPNHEVKMEHVGVFPADWHSLGGDPAPKPANFEELRRILANPMDSPPTIEDFEHFQLFCFRAVTEADIRRSVLPIITGEQDVEFEYLFHTNAEFNNLVRFHPEIRQPRPGTYYGADMRSLHTNVFRDLKHYIAPSINFNAAAVPNFIMEHKIAYQLRPVHLQAANRGVYGARGIFMLQNYGKARTDQLYDHKAYTIVVIFCPVFKILRIYTTHVVAGYNEKEHPYYSRYYSTNEGGFYHTTLLDSYCLAGNLQSFVNGITAYRNACQWAKGIRDGFIAAANSVAASKAAA